MPECQANGLGLIVAKIALKTHGDGLAGVALVANQDPDAVVFQQPAHLLQTAPWESKMLGELLAAGDDARLVPGRKAHRLRFVKLRVLKRCDAYDPVEHGLRKA